MSDLTTCNWCRLQDNKRRNKGKKVKIKNEDGWFRVYIDGKKYGSLFMSIGDHCEC